MLDDDDLSSVLSNIAADARPTTRNKIANSQETRAFLEIGLLLLRDDLLDHRVLTCSTITTLARAYSPGYLRRDSSSGPIKSSPGTRNPRS
jgi:hypothetical protein